MPGVHIVTDSACDLTEQLVKEHNVIVVPLTIRFGQEELEDRRQLTPAEFWERCRGKGALPETAAPSPGAFQAAFQQAADEGADAVLCLTISSKVSGDLLLRRHGGGHVHRPCPCASSTPSR